jgi:hypothetical protein
MPKLFHSDAFIFAFALSSRTICGLGTLGTTSGQLESENPVDFPCKRHQQSTLVLFSASFASRLTGSLLSSVQRQVAHYAGQDRPGWLISPSKEEGARLNDPPCRTSRIPMEASMRIGPGRTQVC